MLAKSKIHLHPAVCFSFLFLLINDKYKPLMNYNDVQLKIFLFNQ